MLYYNAVIRGDLGSRTKREDFKTNASRKHFITRQDCRNVSRKLSDFTKHWHIDDAISVDRLVHELNQEFPSPVIAYKPQGISDAKYNLPSDSFFLVIMSEFQAELYKTFSEIIVCLDSTHRTNQYKHKLTTLVVPDEFHNGIATCMYMLSLL